jgi:hypothetical protein
LHLAVGPPGSGKTVVAIEAAREAWLRDADVLFLVPSSRLVRQVRDALVDGERLAPEPFGAGAPSSAPQVWVERVQDFFRSFGRAREPDGWVANWLRRAYQLPALQRWRAEHPTASGPRFVELVDAVLFDEQATGTKEKDALSNQDDKLRRALEALEGPALRAALGGCRPPDRALRWERARATLDPLRHLHRGRELLILVDEAQDLAPGEWQTLVKAAWHRSARGGPRTTLALFGDENQRITPSAFSWSDVQDFTSGLAPELGRGGGHRRVSLPGSHRTPANIARAAASLMDGSLVGGRHRRAETADPERLQPGGLVLVHVCDAPEALLHEAASTAFRGRDRDDRVVVLPVSEGPLGPHLDALAVEEAKGLEWPAVVLLGLFGDGVDFDARARAYTRLTRAWCQVLILLRPEEWERVGGVWTEAGVPHRTVGAEHLPAVLVGFIDTSGHAQRTSERVSRIESLIEQAESGGEPFPLEVLGETYAVSLLRWGAGEALLSVAATALELMPRWESDLLAATRADDAERAAAAWLLLGDAGAALVHLETHADRSSLLGPLVELVRRGSAFHRASADLRRASGFGRPLTSLIREALLRRCLERLRSAGQIDPPDTVHPAQTRWEHSVQDTIHVTHTEVETMMNEIAGVFGGQWDSSQSGLLQSLHNEALSARVKGLSTRWDRLVSPIGGALDDTTQDGDVIQEGRDP